MLCVASLATSHSGALALEPGDIFVVTQAAGNVYRVDPQTGNRSLLSSGGDLQNPSHVLFDEQGRLLTAERSFGGIVRVHPVTGAQDVVASGGILGTPVALDFDLSGDLVVATREETLVHVDLASSTQSLITNVFDMFSMQDVDVDASGNYVVLDFGSFGSPNGRIIKVDADTLQQTTIASGGMLFNPADLLIDSSGNFIVSNRGGGSGTQILRIDATTGDQFLLADLTSEGFIAFENESTIIYADFNSDSLSRVNLATGASTVFSTGSFEHNATGVIVFRPVPEPTSAALVAICAVFVTVFNWRTVLCRPDRKVISIGKALAN